MSVLAPAPDFDADDGYLHALLGLVAADAMVREPAPSPPAPSSRAGDDADDPVLHAILGVIGLTSLASRTVSSWAAVPRDRATAPVLANPTSPIEGLLR